MTRAPIQIRHPRAPAHGRARALAPRPQHPWHVVAPGYRPGGGALGSAPALQKYSSPDLVNAFLRDPRRSLAFNDDDLVYRVVRHRGRPREVSTGVRKLFLDLHARSYLVSCQVICDAPGTPRVARDHICEAGFVIRRRAGERWQAWVPLEFDGLGAWTDLDAGDGADGAHLEPRDDEARFTLSALVPDPKASDHPGQTSTIYFGVVPTGSGDVEDDGSARFEDGRDYRIVCYVRRHVDGCPRTELGRDCSGPVTVSAPTEPFQLAAPFDLVGTSQRPVNVRLPDLAQLEAQAYSKPFGFGAPFRMVARGNDNMQFDVSDDGQASGGSRNALSCQFAIPLITLVATFVLKLFLPVLTFVMGLWFMLKFKFCLPWGAGASVDVRVPLDIRTEMETTTPSPPAVSAKLELEASAEVSS